MFWTNMEELHFLTTLIDFSDCTRTLESKYHKKISASRQVEWIKHKPFNGRNSGKFSITVHQKQCQEYWSQIQSDLIFQIMHFLLGFWLSILKSNPLHRRLAKMSFGDFVFACYLNIGKLSSRKQREARIKTCRRGYTSITLRVSIKWKFLK